MRDVRRLLVALAAFVALPVLPTAVATAQEVPPNAQFEQYVPDQPGSQGDEAVGGSGGSGGSSNGGDGIPPSHLEELRSSGSAGESAANFFEEQGLQGAGAPGQGDGSERSANRGKGDDAAGATSSSTGLEDSGSLLASVLAALTGQGEEGMGLMLPILLAVIAAGGLALALRRRGGRSIEQG